MIFEAGATGGSDTNNQAIMKLVAGTSANVQIQMGHGTSSSTLNGGFKYKSNNSMEIRTNNAAALVIESDKTVDFKIASDDGSSVNTMSAAAWLPIKVAGTAYFLPLYTTF